MTPAVKIIIDDVTAPVIAKQWTKEHGEGILIEEIAPGSWYIFGSELALLRLANRAEFLRGAVVVYSENLESWYISLEEVAGVVTA